MARRGRRRRMTAAVVALGAVASAIVIGLSGAGPGSGRGPAGTPPAPATSGTATLPATSAPAPDPTGPAPTSVDPAPTAADVAAARACQAFVVYLQDARNGQVPAAAGRALIEDAAALLAGSRKDVALRRRLPRWAPLGEDLLASAEDVVAHRSAALRADGASAGAQCRAVPAAAARAGGFARPG